MDDGGKLFPSVMLSRILNYASSSGRLQYVSSGSEWTVSFLLKQGSTITNFKAVADGAQCVWWAGLDGIKSCDQHVCYFVFM